MNKKIKDMLNRKEVLDLTGFPKSTLYHLINTNGFPSPIKIGTRLARWSKRDILVWFDQKGFDISKE